MKTEEQNRSEFEEWIITKLEYSVSKYRLSEEYLSDAVEVAWEAWQAAREQITEQRDRLAEALERILEYQGRFAEEEPKSIAEEALQCLTTNANVDAPAHE